MRSVNVAELKDQLSKYRTFAKGGEEVVIRDRKCNGSRGKMANGYSLGTTERGGSGSVVHVSDARQSLYVFGALFRDQQGWWFKSTRPDHC
jgi:hypothetical protein